MDKIAEIAGKLSERERKLILWGGENEPRPVIYTLGGKGLAGPISGLLTKSGKAVRKHLNGE